MKQEIVKIHSFERNGFIVTVCEVKMDSQARKELQIKQGIQLKEYMHQK